MLKLDRKDFDVSILVYFV